MKHVKTGAKRGEFDVLLATKGCQAAKMTLQPGGASKAPSNEHPRCEQWLFVIDGTGTATIGKKSGALHSIKLRANSLLLIEKGELHRIANTGKKPLVTINFYVPPAYSSDAEPRASAKRGRSSSHA